LQENFDRFNNALYKEKEMADFRRCIFVLATLALLLGTAVTASAQGTAFQCTANAGVPPLLRSEGVTEKAGDVVLNCVGGTPTDTGRNVATANIQIFLNTSVTSRILDTATSSTEALLTIDEQPPAGQNLCGIINGAQIGAGLGLLCNVQGRGGAGGTYVGSTNTYRGQLAGSNSIVFLGVPIDPPGTTQAARVIRITNVRANASALGVAGGNAPPTPLIEVISASGSTSVPINNPQQTVGFIQRGLTTTLTAGGPFQQCFSVTGGDGGSVTFTEGFATAFKFRTISALGVPVIGAGTPAEQDTPGAIFESESQFYNPNFAAPYNVAGLADFATRLKIVFAGVPAGITLAVPLAPTGAPNFPTLTLQLITSESGAYVAATSGTVTLDTNGNGVAVYEVTGESPTINESISIPISVTYTANPGANSPALGSAQGSGSFAPTSTAADWTSASATDPIPRFINDGTLGLLFTVNKCATHLLFPFVTNEVGFDTGIAISNTSMDQYGTSIQHGTCDLFWYGANAPAKNTTPDIAAGSTWASTAMVMAPNFQGYVIADCQFQYAHGFAFVTRVGAVDIAMGYLALVIPDPPSPRQPNPFDCNNAAGTTVNCNAGSGEQLGM
jgi:hypothetical protein